MVQQRRRDGGAVRFPSGLVDRPRLRAVLDGGSALTIVSGPAGSGKSTLLAQWDRAQDDRAPKRFQVSFGGEITNARTAWREILAQLASSDLVEDARALADDVRGFERLRDVVETVRRGFGGLRAPCVVVIDNFERSEERMLLADLVELLREVPLLRVVISTRRTLTPPLLQIIADTDAAFVGPSQLLFSREEAREVIERVSHRTAPDDSLGDISALPISARLVGLTLLANQWPLGSPDTGRTSVADALMARLISQEMPTEFREFLLCTALPSVVTFDIAGRLGWSEHAGEHLERAETLGLGMWESTGSAFGFAYTPVLREALVRHVEQRSPAMVREHRRVIALWASENKLHLEALSNALDAEDHHLASRLGRKSWFVLSQTRPTDVIELLKRQGPVVLASFPVLATMMALMMVVLGQRLRAFGYFQSAVLSSRRHRGDDDETERFWAASVRTLAARFASQFGRSTASAQEVHDLYLAMDEEKRAGFEDTISLLLSNCATSFLYAGRTEDAITVLEWGMSVQVPDDDGGWYHCASTLAGVRALDGRLNHARRILREIDEADPPASWRTDIFGFPERLAQALVALAELDFAGAQRHLDAVSYLLGTVEHWPFFVSVQSELHLLAGRSAEALRVIETALEKGANSVTSPYGVEQIHVTQAMVLLSLGTPGAADRCIDTLPPSSPAVRVLNGFRALLAGQPESAFTALSGVGAGLETVSGRLLQGLALVTFALASIRIGRADAARRALDQAAAMLKEERTLAPLLLFSHRDLDELKTVADGAAAEVLSAFLERVPAKEDLFAPLPQPVALTSRERAVLRELVATGSTSAIASALFVSSNTVKVQRGSLYRKLGVSSREEALLRAAELGLLVADPAG